jgi:hypothetical protein
MESPQWRKGPSAYSLPPPFRRVRIPSAHLWSSGVVTSLLYTMGWWTGWYQVTNRSQPKEAFLQP